MIRRFFKRLPLLMVILLVLLLQAHAVWTHVARRAMNAALADAKARGEPVRPEDFEHFVHGDPLDAAPLLRGLMADCVSKTPAWKVVNTASPEPRAPLRADEVVALSAVVASVPEAEARFAAVLDFSVAHWNDLFARPVLSTTLPEHAEARNVARVSHFRTLLRQHKDDAAGAARSVRETLAIAARVGERESMISMLVGVGCTALATQDALNLPADLIPPLRADARAEVVSLMRDLLDETAARAALKRAIQFERMQAVNTMQAMAADFGAFATASPKTRSRRVATRLTAWMWRPYLYENAAYATNHYARFIGGLDAPDWPTFVQSAGSMEAPTTRRHLFAGLLTTSLDRPMLAHFRCLADRRIAATVLALRLYEIDHGRRPDTLEALVPAYLPAAPLDPMSKGQPLRYLPTTERPIIYSVGVDGTDDGGSLVVVKPRRDDGEELDTWNTKDRVIDLVRQPRRPAVTEQ